MAARRQYYLLAALVGAVILNIASWLHFRDVQAKWLNVPPAPSMLTASGYGLGDPQFAYRIMGLMLQNLGDTGGRAPPLNSYNYDELVKWFFMASRLDSQSNFIPFLAAYYYGAATDKDKLRTLLTYLYEAGQKPGGERWRWLGHGTFIARYQVEDLDLAMKFAQRLASLDEPDMPVWTSQLPVFILSARGDRDEALSLMLEILKSSADRVHPNEVNFMREYICTRLLTAEEAQNYDLCEGMVN